MINRILASGVKPKRGLTDRCHFFRRPGHVAGPDTGIATHPQREDSMTTVAIKLTQPEAQLGEIPRPAARRRPGSALRFGPAFDADGRGDQQSRGHDRLDARATEPMTDPRWADLDDLVMAPHNAPNTFGVWTASGAMTVDIVLMVLDGIRPGQLLNPDAWQRRRR